MMETDVKILLPLGAFLSSVAFLASDWAWRGVAYL